MSYLYDFVGGFQEVSVTLILVVSSPAVEERYHVLHPSFCQQTQSMLHSTISMVSN